MGLVAFLNFEGNMEVFPSAGEQAMPCSIYLFIAKLMAFIDDRSENVDKIV